MIGLSEISSEALNVEKAELHIKNYSDEKMTVNEADDFWKDQFAKSRSEAKQITSSNIFGISDEDIDLDVDMSEQVLDLLDRFEPDNWERLSEAEKLDAVSGLVKEISSELGLKETPFVFPVDREETYCGSYANGVNTMVLNKNGFDDPKELVDTVAHELRHAYQYMRAETPETYVDRLFKANLENYISPEYNRNGECVNFNDYQSQYVEADARAYARKYTDAMA